MCALKPTPGVGCGLYKFTPTELLVSELLFVSDRKNLLPALFRLQQGQLLIDQTPVLNRSAPLNVG